MDDLSQRVQAFLDAYAGNAPESESVVEIVGDLENDRRRLAELLGNYPERAKLCHDGHEPIVHFGDECPLCVYLWSDDPLPQPSSSAGKSNG